MLFPFLALIAWRAAAAEASACRRPKFEVLRYEEDYSSLADPVCRTEPLDSFKYLGLGPDRYASFGLDARERYEYLRNPDWGRAPTDPGGYLLHRLMVHGDLHFGTGFRAFVQLKTAHTSAQETDARPVDKDTLDLHQGFADASFAADGDKALTLRAGRQEILYGSRLISVREGPNVRLSFDGLRALFRAARWHVDAFGLRPVEAAEGIFDDEHEKGQWFWGIYGGGPVLSEALGIDLYYFGLRRLEALFEQGEGPELRHTLGVRIVGRPGAWDYDFELAYQLGRFGDDQIRAWTTASDTGYTFRTIPARPRLGLKADVTSGDRDPNDRRLETFNPLFPKGNYFGEASLVGPLNNMDLYPSLKLQPFRSLTVGVDWLFFWRQSAADALYRVSGAPQVASGGIGARYVGSQITYSIQWAVHRSLDINATCSRFSPGGFLRRSGLSQTTSFFGAWASYRL